MSDISNDLINELRNFSVPELCDGAGTYKTMDYHIKPMVTQKKIVGPAFPIYVPAGEGAIIADALKEVKKGDVIVIAGHGHCQSSYWGDHRSICAAFAGAEGVVIDGAFRDIDGCEAAGFPVYARALTPGTAGKTGAGAVNVPVRCGGILVNPGDIIVGDRNGVCVIAPSDVENVIYKARQKIKAQEWTIQEMMRTGIIMPKVIFLDKEQNDPRKS